VAPHTTATAVCYVLALGPAALSAWSRNRREQRERQPMRRLLELEANDFEVPQQRPARRWGELFGCLGFGAVVLGLLATPLFWDEILLPP
jgi:hypothetical protein